jgi:ABC-type polysaccharide/polyol phosphate export permease
MKLSAPKKSIYFISIILALLGIIFWLGAFLGFLAPLAPVATWDLIGFILLFIAWLLLFIGVSFKGI